MYEYSVLPFYECDSQIRGILIDVLRIAILWMWIPAQGHTIDTKMCASIAILWMWIPAQGHIEMCIHGIAILWMWIPAQGHTEMCASIAILWMWIPAQGHIDMCTRYCHFMNVNPSSRGKLRCVLRIDLACPPKNNSSNSQSIYVYIPKNIY